MLSALLMTVPLDGQQAKSFREINRGPLDQKRIALTFDAGGEATDLHQLLATLRDAGIHCTFFLTGRWSSKHPELVRKILSEGHEIGNHSWSHPDFTRLDDEHIRSEIQKTEAFLMALTGQSSKPLFRAPFGARNRRVLKTVGELGYHSIYWTLDSLDSVDPPKTAPFLVNRITGKADAALQGAIILMHVGEPSTAVALPSIVADLQRRGFTLVSVSDLLDL